MKLFIFKNKYSEIIFDWSSYVNIDINDYRKNWEPFFCWFPIIIRDEVNKKVLCWLTTVWRYPNRNRNIVQNKKRNKQISDILIADYPNVKSLNNALMIEIKHRMGIFTEEEKVLITPPELIEENSSYLMDLICKTKTNANRKNL